jgi:dTDP-4-amino-4,6-dideoxygalactose transaminase
MIKFLDLHAQYESIRPTIDSAIADVIRRAAFVGGEDVARFETAFAEFQQARHCVAMGNGTDAIEIALEALALPPGSDIIVPANSFIASSESVTRGGHHVVFADADPVTYTLDPDDVRRRIGPRTKAIIVVHLYGHPARMDELLAIARQHDLRVIEDCAQAHGAEHKGRRVGALGDIGTFSFYPGKNLGAYGDGGAVVTNNADLALKCRMIANHGRTEKYNHRFEGRNSRLDGLQAAILLAKLPHLEGWIARRNEVARVYGELLAGIDGLHLPGMAPDGRHAFHLYVIRTEQRDALAAHLAANEIQTGVHYPIALPKLEAYAYLGQADAPLFANRSDVTLLSLPIGEHLSSSDAAQVAHEVRRFFKAA